MSAFVDALRENPRRPYLLDNAAPEIAALVEAAMCAVSECGLNLSLDKLDAALAALDAKVKP